MVGYDVESLFPSILDVEAARMIRCSIQKGDLRIDSFNHQAALRYLRITGGKGYLARCGIGKLEPKWRGEREDLVALGGDKTKDPKNCSQRRSELTETQKSIIEGRTIEVGILVAMSNHLYTFGGKVYLQSSGAPIGLRFTACLASALMKIWDTAWLELLERNGLKKHF